VRVLLVHDYYASSSPSGENVVFEVERKLLQARGHEVSEFVRHSDEIIRQGWWGLLKGAASTAWNPWMAAGIVRKLDEFHPDVVHVHNTFPLVSPSIFHAIGDRAATVLTLHNYRLFCSAAIPMRRNGVICTRCLDEHSVLPSIRLGCYRDSHIANLPLAASVALHRRIRTWTKHVDAFIALTEFQRSLMIKAGLPENLVFVKPNFFPGDPAPIDWHRRENTVVFAGRLSAEKGLISLVNAWAMWGERAPELLIIGDGPLRGDLEALARGLRIKFLGQMSAAAAQGHIAKAKLMVLPSIWFECFPMTIREAFAFGTAVAVSDVGPLPSIVQRGDSGLIFRAGNADSIFKTLQSAWDQPAVLAGLAAAARRTFETYYTEEINYAELLKIYDRALSRSTCAPNAVK
jgi:glycosyltransferase involved in cell wall biosynthesis